MQPASSTYADCEETDTPNSENQKEVCHETENEELVSSIISEKILENNDKELKLENAVVNNDVVHDTKPTDKSNNHTNSDNLNESESTPEIISEMKVDDSKNDKDFEEELVKVEQENEEHYDTEEQGKYLDKTDESESSDFDSNENDDRENGDGEEVNEVQSRSFVVIILDCVTSI